MHTRTHAHPLSDVVLLLLLTHPIFMLKERVVCDCVNAFFISIYVTLCWCPETQKIWVDGCVCVCVGLYHMIQRPVSQRS